MDLYSYICYLNNSLEILVTGWYYMQNVNILNLKLKIPLLYLPLFGDQVEIIFGMYSIQVLNSFSLSVISM